MQNRVVCMKENMQNITIGMPQPLVSKHCTSLISKWDSNKPHNVFFGKSQLYKVTDETVQCYFSTMLF